METALTPLPCNVAELCEQLATCIAWCGGRLSSVDETDDLSTSFRSQELTSVASDLFPTSCHTEYSKLFLDAFRKFQSARKQLVELSIQPESLSNIEPRSIIAFDWRYSLFDGAATPESLGYFDDDYMPPWDTWLIPTSQSGHSADGCYLLAWVPPILAPYVERGIIVDPAESLSWCTATRDGKLELIGWGQPWPSNVARQ